MSTMTKSAPVIFAAFCIVMLPALALRAAVKFDGAVSYEFANSGTSIVINTGMIEDTNKENATGTMLVKLWATTTPYRGGDISGTVIGSYKLEGIKAGQFYRDLRKVVDYTPPGAHGTYFITLTLSEFSHGHYVIVDYRNMQNAATLGPLKPFTISGPCSWKSSYEGGTIGIRVAKISHTKKGTTGSLKLAVWATLAPYRGGALNGWQLGSVIKDGLRPGYTYTDVKNTAKFTPPPEGTYYIVIVLSEFERDQVYRMETYYSIPQAVMFN